MMVVLRHGHPLAAARTLRLAELRATSDLTVRNLDVPRIERELGVLKQRRRAYSPAAEAFVTVLETLARDGLRTVDGGKVPRSPTPRRPRRKA